MNLPECPVRVNRPTPAARPSAAQACAFFPSPDRLDSPAPPLPAEASQFDFWVGAWDASWGEAQRGVNRVSKRWNSVVVEEFDGKPGMDAFEWNWERSLDAGKTWEVQWQIHYTRRR